MPKTLLALKSSLSSIRTFVYVSVFLTVLSTASTTFAAGIAKDKFLHFGVSAVIEAALAEAQPFKKWEPWQRALLNVAVFGIGKELYDRNHSGEFDWNDVSADGVGAAFGEIGVRFIGNRW